MDVLQFLILGLVTGSFYAMLGHSVVVVYRGSGVVNFAAGAQMMAGAYVYMELQGVFGFFGGVLGAILAAALVGALMQLLILGPMHESSPFARVIATLGVMITLQAIAVLRYGTGVMAVPQLLPSDVIQLAPGLTVPVDRIIVLVLAIVVTAGLSILYRYTPFGRETAAVAENQRFLTILGHSPARIAVVNWALGGALAGLVGALIAPISFIQATPMAMYIVPALAVALLGGFRSYWLVLVGGIVVGVSEALVTRFVAAPGWAAAVPFIIIIVVMVIRGQGIPLRSHIADRLPAVGDGKVKLIPIAVIFVVITVFMFTAATSWVDGLTVTLGFAILTLSVMFVSGIGGQISLAQFPLAGLGALIAGKTMELWGIPFLLALVLATVSVALVSAVVALPTLRARGVTLAVVTLGLGVVLFSVVLNNSAITNGMSGIRLPVKEIFGLDINPSLYAERYGVMVLIALVLSGIAVANLRRGRAGRRLLSVRSNERAAASLGVNVRAAKVFAFSFAGGLAALGGVLLSFRLPAVIVAEFTVFGAILLVAAAVVGGIGTIPGVMLGSLLLSGGIISVWLRDAHAIAPYLTLIMGLTLILVLRTNQNGLYEINKHLGHALIHKIAHRRRRSVETATDDAVEQTEEAAAETTERLAAEVPKVIPRTLRVEDVSVRFGTVQAVRSVSFDVGPGEIHGVIGPNGAGKTTFVDAISGFARIESGTVRIDDRDITRLSPQARFRAGISRSFQSLELFPDLTVRENLAIAGDDGRLRRYVTDVFTPGKAKLSSAAEFAVSEFQLGDILDQSPESLSLGRRRLVALARTIASEPSIILMDEPAAGLDDHETAELAEAVRVLARQWGMGVLLIEHNVDMVLSVCDRVTVLQLGAVVTSGTPSEVIADRRVQDAYLGDSEEIAHTSEEIAHTSVT